MKKIELIRLIAKEADITLVEAEKFLSVTTHVIKTSMRKGERVSIAGFGTFYVGKRGARVGRNPKTGATIKIKAANSPKFKAGTKLKSALSKDLAPRDYYSSQSSAASVSGSIIKAPSGTDSTGPKKPKKES